VAILGTFIDRQTVSRAGDAGTTAQNVGLATLAHSLPATNPEAVFINLRSVQGAGGVAEKPQPFGLGGNASILTIGYAYQSGVSAPTIMFDVIAQVFYSTIR
jgi:hypothetical protein